ncbi:exported hypothetical protein [Flavobacterium sp. 9AF]|uniref:LamG-like jellyroll fold domain-containing protein n=1 Tax=Flavobacterium sp. 9AF TaxID=2653142 RepID=UPI0012F45596|nr:LamG-like jellyroll fold domain-containing protein [Flavobacterium sp. 9AF]VXB24097.1 exported hypothetical protein [Flavobacterium sp. 9AF]
MKQKYFKLLCVLFCLSNSMMGQNNAIDLAGTNNYVSLPNTYSLNNSGFTIEFDFYMHSLQNYNGGVSATTNTGLPQPIDFYVDSTGKAKYVFGDGVNYEIIDLITLNAGQWYHIAIVLGQDEISVYIDGGYISSFFPNNFGLIPEYGIGNVRIGDRMDGVTNANAKFDNVRIWSVARTNTEIANNFNTCLTGNEAGLEVYYTFESISGNTVIDLATANGSQDGNIVGTFSTASGAGCSQSINNTALPTTNYTTQVYTGDNKTLATLQVTGTDIKWYDAFTSGNILAPSTILNDNSIYYASQTIGGIESNRLPIRVKRISDNQQYLCDVTNPTVADLSSTPSNDATAQWFSVSTNGTPLTTTDVLNNQDYYIQQITTPSITNLGNGFSVPCGIAIQPDGKILIADFLNNSIKRMNADGTGVVTLNSSFNKPQGVAVQSDGKIIVADTYNNSIKRMNADGTNVVVLGSGFARPQGIAIQADGKIVIADNENNAIKRMNNDGTGIVTLGTGFMLPYDVAIQSDGKIIVSDYGNSRIKRMNEDGTNIVTLSTALSSPIGVDVQADGKIIVTNLGTNEIRRMNSDGTGIETLASGLNGPFGVTVQPDGKIVFSDSNNNLIKRITEATITNRVPVVVKNLTATISNVNGVSTCGAEDGTATLIPTAGVPVYAYQWSDNGTAAARNDLKAITYTGTIQYLNGCIATATITIDDAPFTSPTVTSPVVYNQNDTAVPLTATSGSDDLLWYTSATGGIGDNNAPTPSTSTVGSTSYFVSSTSIYGCESERTEIVVQVGPLQPANYLTFKGDNDYIELTHFEKPNVFTIEAWVKTNYDYNNTIISWSKNSNDTSHTKLRVDDGDVDFYIYDYVNDINNTISSSISINTNWHHIAVVKNANATNNLEIYIDGVLGVTGTANINITSDNLFIGGRSYNNLTPSELYGGGLDELRIWNIARTVTEINASKDCELIGNESGLLAYYKFNQGNDSADNTTVTTLLNEVSGGSNGTLQNFTLSGSLSNWLAGSAVASGITCASLSNTNFNNSEDFLIYPNPSSGIFNLHLKQAATIEVFDLLGNKILEQKVDTPTTSFDVSKNAKGIYILKVTGKNGNTTFKRIIKE